MTLSPHNIQPDSFIASGRFYDDEHFPYGFGRSGQFTRQQAEALEKFGRHLKQLDEGLAVPVSEDEVRFVSVCRGEAAPASLIEQAWLKYKASINGKRFISLNDWTESGNDSDMSSSDFDD